MNLISSIKPTTQATRLSSRLRKATQSAHKQQFYNQKKTPTSTHFRSHAPIQKQNSENLIGHSNFRPQKARVFVGSKNSPFGFQSGAAAVATIFGKNLLRGIMIWTFWGREPSRN